MKAMNVLIGLTVVVLAFISAYLFSGMGTVIRTVPKAQNVSLINTVQKLPERIVTSAQLVSDCAKLLNIPTSIDHYFASDFGHVLDLADRHSRKKNFTKAKDAIAALVDKIDHGCDVSEISEMELEHLDLVDKGIFINDAEWKLGPYLFRDLIGDYILKKFESFAKTNDYVSMRKWFRAALVLKLCECKFKWRDLKALLTHPGFAVLKKEYPGEFEKFELEINRQFDLVVAFDSSVDDYLKAGDKLIRHPDQPIIDSKFDEVLGKIKECKPPPGQSDAAFRFIETLQDFVLILKERNRPDLVDRLRNATETWSISVATDDNENRWLQHVFSYKRTPPTRLFLTVVLGENGAYTEEEEN